MTGLLVFLVLILVGSFIASIVRRIYATRRATADKVRRDLLVADQKVASEHLRARRAMNKAAGQSWRNLAG